MRLKATLLKIIFGTLFLTGFYTSNAQDNISIRGNVIDDNSQPLEGVTVNVKGSSVSTVTNASGNYQINVNDRRAILVFSYSGFATQETPVRGRTSINVHLALNTTAMDEVVVTALNIKKNPKSLGYSISILDGNDVNNVQTPNLINALSGKIAGVDVGNIANGVAGTKKILIRGSSSLTGNNQPLWVIDGIPISSETLGGPKADGGVDYGDGLTGINPDDIENISVLKGNAAAALYGSLASNGVILVTTKSGKSTNGKINVDISSSFLMDRLRNTTNFQFIYGQSGTGDLPPQTPDEAFSSSSWGAKFDGSPALQFDGVIRPFSPVKDNYDRFFNTGTTLTNTVALSGSNNNHNFRVSVSDLRNSDIIPNASFNRTSLNAKTSSKFGGLTADVVVNYTMEGAKNRPYIGGNHSNLFIRWFICPEVSTWITWPPGMAQTERNLPMPAVFQILIM